jgi:methionyl-tRNA formyltransferase
VELPAPPAQPRRVVYLGTPALAVPPLRALVAAGYEVPLVVSKADKRRGRGAELTPSPVKAAALELGLPVTDRVDDVLESDADLGVVVAFGKLIRANVLEALPLVNIHFSLLPRWRGAAPVERAILAGDERTGVCLMTIDEELDTGALYRCEEVAIDPTETLSDLTDRLVGLGTAVLLDALDRGLGEPTPQHGDATYADKLDPAELQLDWEHPAERLLRVIRLERAWTTLGGERLKVLQAAPAARPTDEPLVPGQVAGTLVGTGTDPIDLVEVQAAGRRPQAADDWVRGARLDPDDRLGG